MAKIECTAGYAETPVGGMLYVFDRDQSGRYVAEVHNDEHVEVLLSVVHYRRVDPDETVAPEALPAGGEAATAVAPEQADPIGEAPAPAPTVTEPDDSDGGSATSAPTTADGAVATQAAEPARDPLDHDGDGRKGGSLPKAKEPSLTDIRGIASGTAKKLAEVEITTVEQIASLDAAGIAALDEKLKLHGRIERDEWVAQAKALLAGDEG